MILCKKVVMYCCQELRVVFFFPIIVWHKNVRSGSQAVKLPKESVGAKHNNTDLGNEPCGMSPPIPPPNPQKTGKQNKAGQK